MIVQLVPLHWANTWCVLQVRRAYVWGRFKEPKSKASKAPVPMHPLLAGFLLAWREKTTYSAEGDFVFPSTRLKGKKPLSASILVQKYLRPAAVKAGVIGEGQKIRFGFHNFRHSMASALVKMKVDPKTVQEFLRQAHVTTTLQLYAQSDMESKRDAQGRYLEQMLGDRVHLLTERIQ
jgi:integrase